MAIFYLDTSAIVKRYRTEHGTELVTQLLQDPPPQDRFYISFLAILELTSGVLRLVKGGQLRETVANEILATFRRDVRDLFRIWPLSEEITWSAVTVAEEHKLRSGDAIHLATAQVLSSVEPNVPLVLVTSDRELLEAGINAGLEAMDPASATAVERLATIRAG